MLCELCLRKRKNMGIQIKFISIIISPLPATIAVHKENWIMSRYEKLTQIRMFHNMAGSCGVNDGCAGTFKFHKESSGFFLYIILQCPFVGRQFERYSISQKWYTHTNQ